MTRRTFISSAGAAAVIPVLPLPAAAIPMAAAPVNTTQVGWAALFARVNDRATPALIQKWLGVGPEQAQALMSELTKRNIIHAPIAGHAVSVQPMFPQTGVPGVMKTTGQIVQKVRDLVEGLPDVDVPVEEDVEEETGDETS